nr:hypothetical protein [Tanacetum cinerariifolium]
ETLPISKHDCILSQDFLRFVSRLPAFYLKTSWVLSQDFLRFVSRLPAFVSRLPAFCLKTSYVLSTFENLLCILNKGETIHDYYVWFAKLINDMRNIKMTMSRMQLNSKFVNNMLPERDRFVTAVKLNRGLRDSNYNQLYAYLKQHEAHANENKMMLDRFTQHIVDPLALMSNVSHQQHYSQSSLTPPSTYVSPYLTDNAHLDSSLSLTYNLIENLTNTLALLTQSYKTFLPQQTINLELHQIQGTKLQVEVQLGMGEHRTELGMLIHNSDYFKDKMLLMQAQENGVALDEEQLLFLAGGQDNAIDEDVDEQPVQDLALNVDNVFQADDCDAFDSDVDEAPTAQTMFMANLSFADPIYDIAGPSYDSNILSENIVVENSLTAELAIYKEQVELYERRARLLLKRFRGELRVTHELRVFRLLGQYHDKALLMQAKEKGAVLDAEAKAFLADVECTAPYDQPLALTTTNMFEANHEDAYDSDVDKGPYASAAFMADLSFTGGTNGLSSSHINEVKISDDSFFSDVSYPLAQEMHQEEHLNSEVDSVLDENMITYDEYQNDSGVEAVPTVVSADEADKQSMIAVLQRMHTEIACYVRVNDEHKLVNVTLTAELEWCKIEMQALKRNKVKHDLDMAIVEWNKQNAELEEENVMLKSTFKSKVMSIENLQQESKHVLSEKKTLEDEYLEEIVVLTNANKVATNVLKEYALPINYAKLNALYDLFVPQKELSREQIYWLPATEIASQSSTPAKPVAPFVHTRPVKSDVHKKVKEFERIFDELDAEYERILLEKKNMQIEKKNLLITNECLIANSIANDICSITLAYDLVVPPSYNSSHCMLEELRTTCDREHSKVLKLEAEILKTQQLKEQLQGRDESIRNLQAQNDIMSLLNVGSTDDSCNKQALKTELTQLKDTVTSL